MRGHSYLLNDLHFSIIKAEKRKHRTEVHNDCIIHETRQKPFDVVKV